MRLHRFYIEEKIEAKTFFEKNVRPTESVQSSQFRGKEVKIFDENLLHQMKSVFRLEKGDKVVFFDGSAVQNDQPGVGHLAGRDFECEIQILAKKEGVFEVLAEKPAYIPEKTVTLYLSVIKKDNFELASRMATEIGVSKIVPLLSERSEKKNLDIERLKRIVKEASEQCGRGNLPEVAGITNLELGITNSIQETEEIFVADFGGESIRNLKFVISNCAIFIGAEGGWSDSERELFRSKGAKFISLGETVLRAETAVVVACAELLN